MSPLPLVRNARRVVAAVLLLVTLLVPTVSVAAPPLPSYGTATVDGNSGEWNLTTDFFADMYRAGNPDSDVLAKVYLRYECVVPPIGTNNNVILYALVLPIAGTTIDTTQADAAFIKLGNLKLVDGTDDDDGNAPDFRYIPPVTGNTAAGWEASARLAAGEYNNLNIHTNVFAGGSQTAAVAGRGIDLQLICPPLAVELASFEAAARPDDVLVNWTTASETDNLGFNLYRATSLNGERTRLNGELIPSQVPGGGGAAYEWADDVSEAATYYYWLESVDIAGATSEHGPVSADWPAAPTAVTVSTFGVADAAPYAAFALAGFALAGALALARSGAFKARR